LFSLLDFGQNRWSAPNYLGQSQQRRLLLLVLTAGAVLAAVFYASNPQSWIWLTQLGRQRPQPNHAAIDTRLKPRPPGDAVVMANRPAAAAPERGNRFPGVDAKLLDLVQDDTPVRPAELPAMFQLLGLARRTDPRTLAEASVGIPAFVQLLKQPDAFRGQVLTVRGHVHGVFALPVDKNDDGVRELLQLWIEPDDRSSPIVLDCLDLPKAFPRGNPINEQVEATGFYFKRLAYYLENDKTMQLAPLILAENVEWAPQPAAAPPQGMDWKQLAWAVTAALVAAIVLLAFVLPRRRGKDGNVPYHLAGHRPAAGLEQLDELRNLEVSAESSEALKRIAESEQSPKKSAP